MDKDGWISIHNELPFKVMEEIGNSNWCPVKVLTDKGEVTIAIFGNSGAQGEPYSFFSKKNITHWKRIS